MTQGLIDCILGVIRIIVWIRYTIKETLMWNALLIKTFLLFLVQNMYINRTDLT